MPTTRGSRNAPVATLENAAEEYATNFSWCAIRLPLRSSLNRLPDFFRL